MHHAIGIENSNQRYVVEIKALRDHLCAHENIRLACFECFDNLFVARLRSRGVEIHSPNRCIRKLQLHIFLDLLRSVADSEYPFRTNMLDIASEALRGSRSSDKPSRVGIDDT